MRIANPIHVGIKAVMKSWPPQRHFMFVCSFNTGFDEHEADILTASVKFGS